MLYIATDINTYPWHIGEIFPMQVGSMEGDIYGKIKEIQADGDELEYIYDLFDGIRKTKLCHVVSWFGDDAYFIVYHLARAFGTPKRK